MTKNLSVKKASWETVPTMQFKQIIAALEACKNFQRTGMLIGETGCGKTYTIDKFCAKHGEHTYRLTVSSLHKLPDILNEFCDMLGINLTHINTKVIQVNSLKIRMERIAKVLRKIKEDGGRPLLIIDEGENLGMQTLKAIKALYDAIEDHCGIVIIGTDQLLTKLLNQRRRNRESIPQLYSRFRMGQKNIAAFDKSRDFQPFFNKYITDKTVQKHLTVRCDSYRDLRNAIMPLIEESERMGMPVDETLFNLVFDN